MAFHEGYTSGRVISRQMSDVDAISDLFEEGLDSLISAALTLVLVGTGMLLLDWPLALVVLAGFLPLTWLSALVPPRVGDRLPADQGNRRAGHRALRRDLRRAPGGAGVPQGAAQRGDLRRASRQYAAASLRSSRLIAVFGPGISLVANVAIGLVLCYGGLRVIDGDIKVGVLATFLLYLGRFFDPLQDVSQFYNSFQCAAAGAGEDLRRAGGGAVRAPSRPTPRAARRAAAERRAGGPVRRGAVRLPGRGRAARASTWTSRPGRPWRWSGETGAGKTTVARLLARFYDPGQGRVLLDGVDLRDLPDEVLRREIVLITQENFLFEGTVADNIRLGRPDADRGRGRGGGPGHRRARVHRRAAGRLRTLRSASAAGGCRPGSAS